VELSSGWLARKTEWNRQHPLALTSEPIGDKNQSLGWLCLPPAFMLVPCSAYFSTLKMEAICSSETSVEFQRTTGRYIPENGTLHNYCSDKIKSYINKVAWNVKENVQDKG
jgi:hypothetical protein